MSADNGIFILESPHPDTDAKEFRVAHAFMSPMNELETHWFTPEDEKDYLVYSFGHSRVHDNMEDARKEAFDLGPEDTEYGVQHFRISYPFGTLRDPIEKPGLPEGACPHCSTDFQISYHGPGDVMDAFATCKYPDLPANIISKALHEKCPGVSEHYVTRIVMESLVENGWLLSKVVES